MKKSLLIALVAPIVILSLRLWEIIRAVSILGIKGNYECAISIHKGCSLMDYSFRSDQSIVALILAVVGYTSLFLVSIYFFFLFKLYRSGQRNRFWMVVIVSVVVIIGFFILSETFYRLY
jgi:hypothetical protein